MATPAPAKQKCPLCGAGFTISAAFCPVDGTPLERVPDTEAHGDDDPYIGQTIADDIELREVLGVGAMGRVYRGHQRSIGRDVAVKVLRRELSSNQGLVQRFQREAKIASRIRHAHVVEVYLAGQLSDGALYIVMEHLDGLSLGAALEAAGGAIPVERALPIALQICDAVGEAHSRDIVHRDLKPENVMLISRGESTDWVKVLDFGIAKGTHGEHSLATAAGQIFGTARYISPEGAQGRAVGPEGDVYSLATLVYQMFAGRTPFDANTAVAVLVKHVHDDPPELSSLAESRGVPAEIARVVMDNLAKEPAARAPNAQAFGRALAAAAMAAGIVVPDDGAVARMSLRGLPAADATIADAKPPADDAASLPISRPSPTETPAVVDDSLALPSPPKKERRWVGLALMFVLGVAVAVGVSTVRHRGEAQHDAYVARTQKALAQRHYTGPTGENVRDLVTSGLTQWPDDPALLKLRGDASQELMTRAIALHSGGDVEGARDSARKAFELAPTSYPAKLLSEQYEGELRSFETPAGLATGTPRLLFKVPARVHPGEPVELVGRVLPRSNGPHAAVTDVKFSSGETASAAGTALALVDAGPFAFNAHTSFPEPGRRYVVFEATVDGRLLRAERPVDIAP